VLLKVGRLTLFPCSVLEQLFWCLLNSFEAIVKLIKDFEGRVVVIVCFFISHDLLNVAHSFIDLKRNSNCLCDRSCVFYAQTYEVSHLLEFLYIRLTDRSHVNFIYELNDSERICFFLAVDRADHEVAHASLLSLVVDLVNEVGFLLCVIAEVKLAWLENTSW
jgi:hypothetical protein